MNPKEALKQRLTEARAKAQELGARNNKTDAAKLMKIITLATECLGATATEAQAADALKNIEDALKIAERCLTNDKVKEAGVMSAVMREDGSFPITIIEAGPGNSRDNAWYPADVLERDCQIFEGVKMYANHLTSADEAALEGGPRSIRDWVATVKEVWWDATSQEVRAWVKPVQEWFTSMIEEVGEDMGASIDAYVKASQKFIEGKMRNAVEQFTYCNSVDFVTEAGAGGKVLQAFESRFGPKEASLTDKMDKVRAAVSDRFCDCWSYCENIYDDHVIVCVSDDYYSIDYQVDAAGEVTLAELATPVEKEVSYNPVADPVQPICCPSCGGQVMESTRTTEGVKNVENEELEKRLTESEKRLAESETKTAALEAKVKEGETAESIRSLLSDSGLAVPTKERIVQSLKAGSFADGDGLKVAVEGEIAKERAYIAEIAPGANITGMGEGGAPATEGGVKESVGKDLDGLLGIEEETPAK